MGCEKQSNVDYLFNARKVKLKTFIDPTQNLISTDKICAIHYPYTRRHFFLFFFLSDEFLISLSFWWFLIIKKKRVKEDFRGEISGEEGFEREV